MQIDQQVLELMACPQCKGELKLTKEQVLFCVPCRLCYPIEDGEPNLNLSSATVLSDKGGSMANETTACFKIVSGPDKGEDFKMEVGACKAIGRRIDDERQTQIFNADFTMSLDDQTNKIIHNYISKTSSPRQKITTASDSSGDQNFKRDSDLVLSDMGVSRLHAMLFFDESGVGVLDLVSRNGTFLNGAEVEAAFLKVGDQVQFGETLIEYQA